MIIENGGRLVNPLTTNIPHYIETSQLICKTNQLTGFYMMVTLAFNELLSLSFVINHKL